MITLSLSSPQHFLWRSLSLSLSISLAPLGSARLEVVIDYASEYLGFVCVCVRFSQFRIYFFFYFIPQIVFSSWQSEFQCSRTVRFSSTKTWFSKCYLLSWFCLLLASLVRYLHSIPTSINKFPPLPSSPSPCPNQTSFWCLSVSWWTFLCSFQRHQIVLKQSLWGLITLILIIVYEFSLISIVVDVENFRLRYRFAPIGRNRRIFFNIICISTISSCTTMRQDIGNVCVCMALLPIFETYYQIQWKTHKFFYALLLII